MSPKTPNFRTWTLGDLNHSPPIDISDPVMLVDYMFNSGPAPYLLFVADIDGNCSVDISDLVYPVDYMFAGGPAPLMGCGEPRWTRTDLLGIFPGRVYASGRPESSYAGFKNVSKDTGERSSDFQRTEYRPPVHY